MSVFDSSIISNTLIYKQLNPPQFHTHIIKQDSVVAPYFSKILTVRYIIKKNVHIYENLAYNNNNIIRTNYCCIFKKNKNNNMKISI